MESVTLPHLPDHPLRIGVFAGVQNAAFLRQQLLDGNRDFEYAFLDASAVLSRNHVLAACFRAINDMASDRLKSRNVHSEIVFSLSPNNNVSLSQVRRLSRHPLNARPNALTAPQIAESFRRFGLSDDSKNILAIKVGGEPEAIDKHLGEQVKGQLVPFTDETLAAMSDAARLKKVYKIDLNAAGKKETEAFLLGSMALKGT